MQGSSSKQQPVAKTKALFWEKLDPKKVDISRTVWHTMPKRDVPEETVAALELFFPASLSSAKGECLQIDHHAKVPLFPPVKIHAISFWAHSLDGSCDQQ